MTWKALQAEVAQALQGNWQPDEEHQSSVFTWASEQGRLSPVQQVSVYQHSIESRSLSMLEDLFPCCLKLVGHAFFGQLLRYFVQAHPCEVPDLGEYAKPIPEFIKRYPAAESVPYLAEIARLEWLIDRAFTQTQLQGQARESAAQILAVPESTQLQRQQGVAVMDSAYSVLDIWQYCQVDYTDKEFCSPVDEPQRLVIACQQEGLSIEKLNDLEWACLCRMESPVGLVDLLREFPSQETVTVLEDLLQKQWVYLSQGEVNETSKITPVGQTYR